MKLLIVDDQATNRKLLRATLEAEQHQVLEASDGLEALKILAREPVDAIISDILMPNMDGFRFCQEVRKSPKHCELPFIVYTSTYTSASDQKLARNMGADSYLLKPASAAVIFAALREATQASTRRRAPRGLAEDCYVLKQYNQALVSKLEVKNADLHAAIEETRRAHDRLVELNHELERRVQQRTTELAQANEKLQRRNEELQNCYHTLSHELKTPLTSAREFISIVIDGLAGPISETQSEYLSYARESCDQLTVCINDLTDATRLETGKLAIDLQKGSLGEVARRVVAGFRNLALEKTIKLQLEVPADLPEIAFDDARITQVLNNLVHNAFKFTPEGGFIRLAVTTGSGREGFLHVVVSDSGPGIATDQRTRIFDRLYQIKAGDAASEKGIGLGLYICRELVLLHGGQIWVESEPGKGSSFNFTLPVNAATNSGTILVVDDDADLRTITMKTLEKAGYQVLTANDGQQALALMERQLPNLLILDLAMPGMDGASLLKQVRKTWGSLPVIVHTGHATSRLMDEALESSPFTVLAKPCPAAQLVETVKQLRKQSDTRFWRKGERRQGTNKCCGHEVPLETSATEPPRGDDPTLKLFKNTICKP